MLGAVRRVAGGRQGVGFRSERGITLIEMSVAIVLLSAVIGVFGPALVSGTRAGRVLGNESRAIDEIRVAVAQIDRELRSACLVSQPALNSSGSVLTFKTEVDPDLGPYEVTYQVVDGVLTRTVGTETDEIGEGLVVTDDEFSHAENTAGTRAQITIDLQVSFESGNTPRNVSTTIAGRNTWSGCN